MCDQTSLTRVPHLVKMQEVACSIKVQKDQLQVLTGVSISREMSSTRLIRLLRLNRGMRPTMRVMFLWGLIVIPPKTTLMKKRCTEISIVSKILRRRSKKERLKNKNSSTKFNLMFRPSKTSLMPSQDKKQMRKTSKRSRMPEKNNRIAKYPRNST